MAIGRWNYITVLWWGERYVRDWQRRPFCPAVFGTQHFLVPRLGSLARALKLCSWCGHCGFPGSSGRCIDGTASNNGRQKRKKASPRLSTSKELGALERGCGSTLPDSQVSAYRCLSHLETWHSEDGPSGPSSESRGQSQQVGFQGSLPTSARAYFQMFYKLEFPAIGHLKKNILLI